MDDLISRQAAINILDAYQVMVENGEEKPYAWARLRMSELPSAQQRGTVVTCGIDKCKHNDDGLCKAESIYLSEDHACDGGCDDGWFFDEKEIED